MPQTSNHPTAEPTGRVTRLMTSAYDQVSSLLVALVVMVGVFVFALLVTFFSGQVFPTEEPVEITLSQIGSRPPEAAFGFGRDLEEPGIEDAPALSEPAIQRTLSAISVAATERAAMLDDKTIEAGLLPSKGRGMGDSRELGTGAEGISERVPRAERWEIHFQGGDLMAYARQLDFFGIELAVLSGEDNLVYYAYNVAQPQPSRRSQPPDQEQRLYMTWRAGPLQAADRELLSKADIAPQGRIILQVYPRQTEDMLALKELQQAGKRGVNDIRKTIFGVRLQGEGYEFYVIDQRYF